jgi:hypothetical protein
MFCLQATAQGEDHHAHMHHEASAAFTINEVWSRAMPPNAPTGAVYFTLQNPADQEDRLLAARTPRAERTELHTHVQQGELMSMQKVESVVVPANGTLQFKPGGHHVMLFKMTEPLRAGDSFPLTLQFEKAGELTLEVRILDQAPGADPHAHH